MNERVTKWMICLALFFISGCNQMWADHKEVQLLRQDLAKFRTDCERLNKQVGELTRLTADLREQANIIKEARALADSRPVPIPEKDPAKVKEVPRDRQPQPSPGLCETIETHIAAVEGTLTAADVDSPEPLLDDLEAVFAANLKNFSNHPKIREIREAAANMRGNYLTAAKQTPLAANPYLKNVRQKSINEGRKAARTLRSLCEE